MSTLLPRRALADPAAAALAALLDPFTARVREPELLSLATDVDVRQPLSALHALVSRLRAEVREIDRVRERADRLRAAALDHEEATRPDLVAEYLRTSDRGATQLRADLGAVARGQLDAAALLEREGAEIEAIGARIEVGLRLLPALVRRAAEEDEAATAEAVGAGGALGLATSLAGTERRRPTRLAAVRAVGLLLGPYALPWGLGAESLRLLSRIVRDRSAGPWVRRAALRAAATLPTTQALALLQLGLDSGVAEDEHLVRAGAVELALDRADFPAGTLIPALGRDDSELVRFTLADGLARRVGLAWPEAPADVVALLACTDPRTRARAAWALGEAGRAGLVLLPALVRDEAPVARVALDAAIAALRRGEPCPQQLAESAADLGPDAPPPLARRAALLRHLVAASASPARDAAAAVGSLHPGQTVELRLPLDVTALELARCLVPLADEGHGFVLDPKGGPDSAGALVRVSRGDQATPTLWRLLHELRTPAPAKRQAHTHVVGRADLGPLRVPPARLAEATPTGVPGQRVHLDRQDGWAPEVPMVDDLAASLDHGQVLIVTAMGTTRVQPPRRGRRLLTRLRLAWRYRDLDRLRNAALDTEDPRIAASWDQTLSELGFDVQHAPGRPAATSGRAWLDPITFGITMAGSTLTHLGLVVALLAAVLFGRLTWARYQLRRARVALPLVIGGWGTRGKSGTERLKAGLFEAMGIPVLCKTTGCEAMVLHAPPGGNARELFLYRPYDKATIWEQAQVALLGPRLGARVLLWECMALNPRYVDLLQSWWMRDDLSTLTNAFPDHEDIQGPTGIDVAEVIAGFAPPSRHLITTEAGMLPVLREVARERGATVQAVHPVEPELLPSDLLARFRHSEHPANVALVATLAEGLGIHPVEAIGWMAERVVADVGALVVHPPVPTAGRRITFAQGQSANDPLSFRHSWRTAGFEDPCPVDEWRVSVVNNRADRVARSRMFAGLLADRAAAHRHVLIGTNLQGLRRYLAEAVDARLQRTDLSSTGACQRLFEHLRLPPPGPLAAALGARLGVGADALAAFQSSLAALPPAPAPTWPAARAAAAALRPAAEALARSLPRQHSSLGAELATHLVEATARHLALQAALGATASARADLYRALVEASLVIVTDPKASGDQIIDQALRAAPPGAHVRLMGLQNIKGTGLDFAYRWVEWGVLHPLLADLPAAGANQRARILGMLGTRSYGSVMACDGVLAVLDGMAADGALRAARSHVVARRQALLDGRSADPGGGGMITAALGLVERSLDPFHAILRRRQAHAVLDALAGQRISHDRAQRDLQTLTDHQKGGWLVKKR